MEPLSDSEILDSAASLTGDSPSEGGGPRRRRSPVHVLLWLACFPSMPAPGEVHFCWRRCCGLVSRSVGLLAAIVSAFVVVAALSGGLTTSSAPGFVLQVGALAIITASHVLRYVCLCVYVPRRLRAVVSELAPESDCRLMWMAFGMFLPFLPAVIICSRCAGFWGDLWPIFCVSYACHCAVALLLTAECEVLRQRLDNLVEGVVSFRLRSPSEIAAGIASLQEEVRDNGRYWNCWNFWAVSLDASAAVIGIALSTAWTLGVRNPETLAGPFVLIFSTAFIVFQAWPLAGWNDALVAARVRLVPDDRNAIGVLTAAHLITSQPCTLKLYGVIAMTRNDIVIKAATALLSPLFLAVVRKLVSLEVPTQTTPSTFV